MKCPVDFRGIGIFHAGPIIKEEPGKYTMISIGPTSPSAWRATPRNLEATGVKIKVGKRRHGPQDRPGVQG